MGEAGSKFVITRSPGGRGEADAEDNGEEGKEQARERRIEPSCCLNLIDHRGVARRSAGGDRPHGFRTRGVDSHVMIAALLTAGQAIKDDRLSSRRV